MAVQTSRGSIVVGIDASPDSDRAVEWAIEFASRTDQPVHFVHVRPEPPRTLTDADPQSRWEEAGRSILDAAVERAEQDVGRRVTGEILADSGVSAAEALVRASTDASMLVVGARGHGGYAGLLMGSVSQHAARQAHCPVVTVRRTMHEAEDRVVVGVDASDGAEDALAFALQIAAAREAPLMAIHAWNAPSLHGAGVTLPMPADTGRAIKIEEQRLAEQLAPWRDKYPGVRIGSEVIPGHAAPVLAAASDRAALVVVGSRGLGAFAGMLQGSVSQAVLHHAHCSVAVAR